MENKKLLVGMAIVALLVGILVQSIIFPSTKTSTEQKEQIMDRIALEGKIRACYIVWPPTVIKDPNTGKLSGHLIDAFEYIAEKSDFKVEYTETTWGTFIAALQSKQCDVVVTGLFSTIERAKVVAFTRPMFYVHNSALIKRGDVRFKTIEDFNQPGIKIAVIQGEAGHLYARKHLQNADLIVLPGADITLAMAQVTSGKADAAFSDGWVVEQYVRAHPETQDFLEINPNAVYGINPTGWAVRYEDDDLLHFLNTAITDLEAEGKLLEFERRYDAHWMREPFELEKS